MLHGGQLSAQRIALGRYLPVYLYQAFVVMLIAPGDNGVWQFRVLTTQIAIYSTAVLVHLSLPRLFRRSGAVAIVVLITFLLAFFGPVSGYVLPW